VIPTIGRTVHYREQDSQPDEPPDAAIVIGVPPIYRPDSNVLLAVFSVRFGDHRALAAEGTGPGTWSWPPRVEAPAPPVAIDMGQLTPILDVLVAKQLEALGVSDLRELVAQAIEKIGAGILGGQDAPDRQKG
jgi:hypothetical protein